MQCPYCIVPLREVSLTTTSDQSATIHECLNCGGHWFPRWLANDISLNTAKNIDSVIPQSQIVAPQSSRCPECRNRLILIQHDSIAQGVTVLNCPQGHGNFFPKNNLFQFKKAQEAKITYHQIWGIPIKSALAVLLPVIAIITIAAGTPIIVKQIGQTQETRTQASAIIRTPITTQLTTNSAIISFTSSTPLVCDLTIYQNQNIFTTLPVSTSPKTVHSITVDNLPAGGGLTFIIKYTDPRGQIISTPSYPLVLQ